jgi:acid phosphatase type 7
MKRAAAAAAAAVLAGTAAAADTTPGQFRLALAGGGGMRVSWSTPDAAPTQCSYGTTPALGQTATGTSASYGWSWHHHVLLPQLAPSTTYYYACGGAATPTAFASPPAPGSRAPFGVAVYGDWGWLDSVQRPTLPVGGLQANWSATLTRQLLEGLKDKGAYELIYHVGDIAYEDDGFGHPDGLLNFTYERDYDGWFDWIENISSARPYMVAAGNHESECHSPYCILNLNSTGLKLNNFTAYNARWAMPGADSGGVLAMWHSFDYANAHFVAADTSTDFPGAPEGTTGDGGFPFLPAGSFGAPGQYMAWLEADLAAAAASRAAGKIDWIIAGAHRPFEECVRVLGVGVR